MAKDLRRCKLEDIQACHLAIDDALRAAIRIVRYHARTEADAQVLRELDAARVALRRAWHIITVEHPQGVHHGK